MIHHLSVGSINLDDLRTKKFTRLVAGPNRAYKAKIRYDIKKFYGIADLFYRVSPIFKYNRVAFKWRSIELLQIFTVTLFFHDILRNKSERRRIDAVP